MNGIPGIQNQPDKKQSPFEGHRKRLRERFAKNGISALHLHEIVEVMLSFVIPRQDTKPVARELVRRYKSLSALLNAPAEELIKVEGIGNRSAGFFTFIREVAALCLKEKYERKSVIAHRRDAEEYLRFHFGLRRDEYFAVLFLGNRNHVIETEVIAEGTVNQCSVYPRIIMEKALLYHAASIIVAHNHPGGGLLPSEPDWTLTAELFAVGEMLGISLLDHLVISQEQVVSLKDLPRWPGKGKN